MMDLDFYSFGLWTGLWLMNELYAYKTIVELTIVELQRIQSNLDNTIKKSINHAEKTTVCSFNSGIFEVRF